MALCFPGPQPDAHLLNMIGSRRRDITITGVTVHTGADEEGAERGAKNTTTVRIKIGGKEATSQLHSYLESFFFLLFPPSSNSMRHQVEDPAGYPPWLDARGAPLVARVASCWETVN